MTEVTEPSWQTRAVCAFLRATRKRGYATEAAGRRAMAGSRPAATPPRAVRERVTRREVGGFPVDTVHPSGPVRPAAGALLYFHGGTFVNGIATQHWSLVDLLARRAERPVHVPHYGRLPAYDVGDALRLLDDLWAALADEGPLYLAGDSAGGNLALLLAQAHPRDPRIAGLTLIAPWLDLSVGHPEVDALEPLDPWLGRPGVRPIAAAWAAGRDLRDPAISPGFGSRDGLPPTAVLIGTRDIGYPDARDFAAGCDQVALHVAHGSPHVYPLLPTPEGRRGREQIVAHVRDSFAAAAERGSRGSGI